LNSEQCKKDEKTSALKKDSAYQPEAQQKRRADTDGFS
jgi:hypothetical protein